MAIRLNNSFFRVRDGVFRSIEPFISSGGGPLVYNITELITTTGAGTFTKPDGVTSVTVECWGGGGAGGGTNTNNTGGGGGAGAQFARKLITYSSAQQSLSYTVAASVAGSSGNGTTGNDTIWDTSVVVAKGGEGGQVGQVGVALGGASSVVGGIGDIVYAGGNGGEGFFNTPFVIPGTGGYGAGSIEFIGVTSVETVPEFGGATAFIDQISSTGADGIAGNNYGGGGSGGGKVSGPSVNGGAGAQGLIRVSYQIQPPLQTYTGSNAAYSIRQLSTEATASMQVQRSSDNTTLDIGFQADGMLDTGSITTFVGSETGYVKRWYDQLGGGYDFEPFNVSPTTWPLIVISGSLQTINGKPTIAFRAGQTLIIANADRSYTTGGGLWFQFVVGQSADATTRVLTKLGNNTNIAQALRRGATAMEAIGYNTVGGTGTDANGVSPGTAQFITYVQRTATGIEIYMNGASNGATSVTGTPQTEATSNMTLGSFNPATISFPWSGSVQEIIHYPQDSATFTYRTGLTAELNAYYGTF